MAARKSPMAVAATLTAIAGSSDVVDRGFVANVDLAGEGPRQLRRARFPRPLRTLATSSR